MNYETDPEVILRNAEAIAEREADRLAAAYDPTYACVTCGAVVADQPAGHGVDCAVSVCPDCPWCNPAVTGAALLALFAGKMRGIWLPLNVKLSRAGAQSSNPGGLWIAESGEFGRFLGSVRADGTMRMVREWSAFNRATDGSASEMLKRLAAFGTAELARIGRDFGFCCYCGRLLTDPVSVALGYGPICAGYHGLPHDREAAGLDVRGPSVVAA